MPVTSDLNVKEPLDHVLCYPGKMFERLRPQILALNARILPFVMVFSACAFFVCVIIWLEAVEYVKILEVSSIKV